MIYKSVSCCLSPGLEHKITPQTCP